MTWHTIYPFRVTFNVYFERLDVDCVLQGGKWTTYRSMAEETLDAAIKEHKLHAGPSRTVGLTLDGGKDWTPTLYIRLVQDYGLENEVSFQNQEGTNYY